MVNRVCFCETAAILYAACSNSTITVLDLSFSRRSTTIDAEDKIAQTKRLEACLHAIAKPVTSVLKEERNTF